MRPNDVVRVEVDDVKFLVAIAARAEWSMCGGVNVIAAMAETKLVRSALLCLRFNCFATFAGLVQLNFCNVHEHR